MLASLELRSGTVVQMDKVNMPLDMHIVYALCRPVPISRLQGQGGGAGVTVRHDGSCRTRGQNQLDAKTHRLRSVCPQFIAKANPTPSSKLAFVTYLYLPLYIRNSHLWLHLVALKLTDAPHSPTPSRDSGDCPSQPSACSWRGVIENDRFSYLCRT